RSSLSLLNKVAQLFAHRTPVKLLGQVFASPAVRIGIVQFRTDWIVGGPCRCHRAAADQHGEQHDDGRRRGQKVWQRGVDDHATLSAALAVSFSRKPSHIRRTSSVAVEHCSISSNMRLPSLRYRDAVFLISFSMA